jgi:serine/threonine-protein kinase
VSGDVIIGDKWRAMDMKNETIYRNRYRILRKIGEGGSSAVYMASDNESGEPVTIKCIRSDGYSDADIKDIAREETRILRKLDHRAIPKVVAAYDDAFVLEYVPGNSLEKVIAKGGKLKEKEVVRIAKELVDILGYLHRQKEPVVYRDLKPANIIIKPDGHVSLIDFGAARFFRHGDAADTLNLGTYGYAAPEQFGSLGQTDPRTDIYCLGRTLEQIIKGKPSRELESIIDKCTKPDRDDRFKSCQEIEEALKKYPIQVLGHRAIYNARIAFLAAAAALVITFTSNNYESIKSYAAYDAEMRLPAVKDRLGNAGLRIKEILKERFAIDLDEEIQGNAVLLDMFGEADR